MVFYVKNDESYEVERISNLSDLHTWGGSTDKIKDVIDAGLDDKLLDHLECCSPKISEDGFPLWMDTELNDYLWHDDEDWRDAIGFLYEDEMIESIKESLRDNEYFSDFADIAEKYNFSPDIDTVREKLLSSNDRLFSDIDEYKNRKDIEIFDELLQKYGNDLTSLYDELCSLVEDEDEVINVFLNETLKQLDKRILQFSYDDIYDLYNDLV